ncbi:MAG: hypothetical protein NVS3B10_00560 [Polyangiales bacterium]
MIGHDPRPSEVQMRRTRELHDILLPALREVARRHGYALAVHGSLQRDIDLVAAPWTEHATTAANFARDIYAACAAIVGCVTGPAGWTEGNDSPPPSGSLPNPASKPHGRLGWTIHFTGASYIDLSVMPRVERVDATDPSKAVP